MRLSNTKLTPWNCWQKMQIHLITGLPIPMLSAITVNILSISGPSAPVERGFFQWLESL